MAAHLRRYQALASILGWTVSSCATKDFLDAMTSKETKGIMRLKDNHSLHEDSFS